MKLGYARASTDGQSVEAQVRQLAKAGCAKVLRETASGAQTDRAQLRRAFGQLAPGDVLMVTRLDRLACSTRDLLNTLATITDRKAGFRSLGDQWVDTTTAHGRLMLTVPGGLAEFEGELIRVRTGEGRARAVARGVKLGRKPKLTPQQVKEALRRRDAGEATREIARTYNVSHSTVRGCHYNAVSDADGQVIAGCAQVLKDAPSIDSIELKHPRKGVRPLSLWADGQVVDLYPTSIRDENGRIIIEPEDESRFFLLINNTPKPNFKERWAATTIGDAAQNVIAWAIIIAVGWALSWLIGKSLNALQQALCL